MKESCLICLHCDEELICNNQLSDQYEMSTRWSGKDGKFLNCEKCEL